MRILSIVLFATACTPSGIYMITVPYSDGAVDCSTDIEENFSDGYAPDEEDAANSEWTYDDDFVGADQVIFFHVAPTSGGGAVLTWGDLVFPGVAEGDGHTFSWTEATSGFETAEHEDGYVYDARFTTDSTVDIHISAPMLADLAGTISASSLSVQTYVESDEWDFEDTDFGAGNIPSSAYLQYKEDGDMFPQGNGFEDDDCDGDECELQVTDACDQVASPFTAKHVEGDDVLLFNDWKEDGQ